MCDHVRVGGLYLVNLGNHKSPELSSPHYCVVLKTHDSGLYLVLPTTSKPKKDAYKYTIPEDGSTCLFKHMRTISKSRILKPLLNHETGKQVILSNEHLSKLLELYIEYINTICKHAIQANKDFEKYLETMNISLAL